ncbi:hypothetical protein AGMMS49991_01940 [Spirochaetia bacterium]|nr:hypothetical protein AGMMS49991_01940 [Spirochaetia bacterium]
MKYMKMIRANVSRALGILGSLLLLAGCSDIFNAPSEKGTAPTGNVTIEISGDGSARTVHPDMSGLTYELSFSGPVTVAPIAVTGGSATVLLQQGSWTISAAAKNGDAPVADGSWTGEVGSEPVNVSITLAPITGAGMTGTLIYTINGLANAQTAALSLTQFTDAETEGTVIDLNGTEAGTARDLKAGGADYDALSLAAGMYLLNVQLTDSGGTLVGRTEAVHVYTGLSTAVVYDFTSGIDFQTPLPLTLETWTNGSLAAGGQQWYSFTATVATQYIHAAFGTLDSSNGVYVQLYDSNGVAVGSQTRLNDTAPSISRTVTSGSVYYLKVWPYSGFGTYQIAFGGNAVPGSTKETASPLTADTWANGSLASGGEQWYSFTATAATQYIHTTFGTLTSLYVQLYDNNGAVVGSQTTLSGSTTSISRTVTIGNVYYVKVWSYSSSTGTYQIAFNSGIAPPGTPILTVDTWADGSLASGGQQWYSFTATAATQYIYAAFGTLTDLYVQLYDSTGAEVGSYTRLSGSATFTSRPVTGGNVYYVKVTPYSSSTGTYHVAFGGIVPPGTTPTILTADTWADGNLASGGQQWFSFTATGTTQYIHAASGTLPYLYVQLYDSTGAELGSQTLLTTSTSTSRPVTSGNVYYIKVTPYSSSYTGTYQIAFNSGIWTPGTPILTADTWADGSLASGGQQWFSFTATAATQYIYAAFGTLASGYGVNVQLYDSTGSVVGSQTRLYSGATSASRTVTSGNVYYIKVTPYSSSYTGTYQITFGYIAPPGTPILTVDTWANGSLASGGEQWFSFTATAATQYIHVAFGTLTNLYVRLYDSNGAEVGSYTQLSGSATFTSRPVTNGNVYYVKVTPYSSLTGTYQIAFGGFGPPGTPILTADTWVNGSLASGGQQWFSFTATAAIHYIHVTFGTLTNLYVQLYDSTGAELGSQTQLSGSTASTSRTVTIGDVYYVRVTPYYSSTGTYPVQRQRLLWPIPGPMAALL